MAEEHLPESSDESSRANRLRQRLVGAAVLIALAVLLLPIWLDGSGLRAPRVEPVPPPPKVTQPKTVDVPKPAPPQMAQLQHPPRTLMPPPSDAQGVSGSQGASSAQKNTDTSAPAAKMPVDSSPAPQPKAKQPPAVNQHGATPATASAASKDSAASAPKATDASSGKWVVQLGSFSDELNARGLQKSVSEAGFKVYVEPLFAKKGTVWRVRVGPFATRADASKATERLRERLGRDGLVMAQ